MSVKLRLVGTVYHFDICIDGHRIRGTTRECSEQRAWKVAEKKWLEAKNRWQGKEPTPTLAHAAEGWIEIHRRTRSENYLRSMEAFRNHHLHGLGGVRLDRLSKGVVERALDQHLLTHKLASGYAWLRNLKVICRWAMTERMLDALPFHIPMIKLQERAKVTIPGDKVDAWLKALDEATTNRDIRLACRLMLFLGLREQEALRARWEWLNLERGTYTPGETKGREAWPIPILLIRPHLEAVARPSGWMIPGKAGHPHTHGFVLRAMALANAAVGAPGVTPHRLRGTFATLLARTGMFDIKQIQRAMRHKDPRTTWLYLGEDLSGLVAGMERVGAAISA